MQNLASVLQFLRLRGTVLFLGGVKLTVTWTNFEIRLGSGETGSLLFTFHDASSAQGLLS